MSRDYLRGSLAGFFVVLSTAGTLAADTPASQPGVAVQTSPSTQPAVSAATALLQRVNAAYAQLQTAEFDGTVTGHFDVAGQGRDEQEVFTSTYAAPNRFRHEAKNDVLLGSTGETAYAFEPARNVYLQADAPKDRTSLGDWPTAITGVLQRQNPSMLLALTSTAAGASSLSDLSEEMTRPPDTVLDGTPYPTLQFDVPSQGLVTLLMDPQTYLLRQMRTDLRGSMQQRGATDVRQAIVTVDYRPALAAVPTAGADPARFSCTPPRNATPAGAAAPAAVPTDTGDTAKAMVGKPAPAFSLPDLNDQPVSLAKQKGSVVVLDFWATWCGPCVMSLPHLDALYKEKAAAGLKVFAVNLQEDKPTVQPFVKSKGWTLPVLLDVTGDVAQKYAAEAIPETVVVGKDGVVRAVFVGAGSEDDIRAAVETAMAR